MSCTDGRTRGVWGRSRASHPCVRTRPTRARAQSPTSSPPGQNKQPLVPFRVTRMTQQIVAQHPSPIYLDGKGQVDPHRADGQLRRVPLQHLDVAVRIGRDLARPGQHLRRRQGGRCTTDDGGVSACECSMKRRAVGTFCRAAGLVCQRPYSTIVTSSSSDWSPVRDEKKRYQ